MSLLKLILLTISIVFICVSIVRVVVKDFLEAKYRVLYKKVDERKHWDRWLFVLGLIIGVIGLILK